MARGYYLTIEASESSYNSINNTSNVSITVKGHSPVELAYGAWDYDASTMYITCNGVQKAVTVSSYDFRNATTLTLANTIFNDIEHNADGTKTIDISASWASGNAYVLNSSGGGTLTASTSLTLTSIARKALIKNATDFNDEQNPTITYSNLAGDDVSSLQACISLTGTSDDISYRDIDKNGNTYTFSLTEAERNVLRNATTTGNSREVIFIVKTVLNGTAYHSTLAKTLYIVNANPTIGSITYKDTNSSVVNVTGDNQKLVQNKSTLRISFTAPTFKKGASLLNHSFTLNNVTKTSTASSGYIDFGNVDSANNLTLTSKVTDTRGNVAVNEKEITILEYKNLTAKITLNRLNNYEDTTYLTVDSDYAYIDGKNSVTVKYQYKEVNGSYNSLVTINDGEKTTLTTDKNKEYLFNITVTDLLGGSYSKEVSLGKGVFPLFIDTNKNSVSMNMFPSHERSFEVNGDIYCNNIYGNNAVVLYDGVNAGGTLEDITLSDSVANYKYVEIFATKDNESGIWSAKAPSPQGRTVNVGTQYYSPNTAVQIVCKNVVLQDNKLIHGTEYYINFAFNIGSMISIGEQNTVKILMVVGYK